jgi:hypothetical protein
MIKTENELFNFLKLNVYCDLKPTKYQMSKWDCYSKNARHIIELKCRKEHYDELLIEKIKYDNLIEKGFKYKSVPMYINSTPNGVYRFNLDFINPRWTKRQQPKTTEFENNLKVEKVVGFLNINDSDKLN